MVATKLCPYGVNLLHVWSSMLGLESIGLGYLGTRLQLLHAQLPTPQLGSVHLQPPPFGFHAFCLGRQSLRLTLAAEELCTLGPRGLGLGSCRFELDAVLARVHMIGLYDVDLWPCSL